MKHALWLAFAALLSTAAHAQKVYRCGASYSQAPCAQGHAVEVSDDRSAQQRRDAIEVVQRDRMLAESLEQDRVAREAQSRPGAARIDGRIGYARHPQAEPAKKAQASQSSASKKKRASKSPKQAERYKAVSASG